MMEITYYKILWHTSSDWYDECSFKTKEQAEEIAELLKDYILADSYDIEEHTVDIMDNFDEYKNRVLTFLESKK